MAVCQKWLSTITEKSSLLWSSRGKAEILEYLPFFFLRKENVLSRKTTSTITFALGSLCNTTTRKITWTRFLYFWLLPELAFKLCSCVQNTCLCYIKKKRKCSKIMQDLHKTRKFYEWEQMKMGNIQMPSKEKKVIKVDWRVKTSFVR